MLKRGFISWLVAIAAATTATADVIHLVNGGRLEGKVEKTAEGYRITTETGVSIFPAEEVARWEKKPTRQEEYALRAAATPLDDFYAQFSLAEWCRSHDMPDQARYHFLLAVALNPQNPEARRGAGYIREGGIWITVEESRRRRGLVEVNGKWLPEEEALRLQLAAEREKRTQEAIAEATRIFHAIKDAETALDPLAAKIAEFGTCLLPTLERFSSSREARERRLAFLALGRFACRASQDLLLRRLATEQQDEALLAILRAFRARQDRREVLSRLLDMAVNRPTRRLRQRACLTLRAMADKRAIDALVPLAGYSPVKEASLPKQSSGTIILTNARSASVDGQQVTASGPRPQKPYYPAHEALLYLTGQMLPPDAKRWEEWWLVKRPNFVFKPVPGIDPPESSDDAGDDDKIPLSLSMPREDEKSAEEITPLPVASPPSPPTAAPSHAADDVIDATPPTL